MLDYNIQSRHVFVAIAGKDLSYSSAIRSTLLKYFSRVTFSEKLPKTLSELRMLQLKHRFTHVITTSYPLLGTIDSSIEGTAKDNLGTIATFPTITVRDAKPSFVRTVLIPSLSWLFTVPHGHFIIERYIRKLSIGFVRKDPFSYEFVTPANLDSLVLQANTSSFLCAVDIETQKEDLRIVSVAYTFGFAVGSRIVTKNYVVRMTPEEYPFCVTAMRVLNNTKCPKVMQNGRYDSTYFLRYNAPLHNYIYDTYHMQHCLYPELEKDLASISSFYLDDYRYWKDESGRNIYEYNAKDTHNTFWTWLAQIEHANEAGQIYAIRNYLIEFPLVFPSISCGLDGLEVCEETRMSERAREAERQRESLQRLNHIIGETNFNPGSANQVKDLMKALGYRKDVGTSEKELRDWAQEHPLYDILVKLIWDYRGATKAISTYFDVELLDGRLLYSLDPAGTDSGRMASKGSNFWCGTQIQNIPRYARRMVRAPEGWSYASVDKAQSESYCTAHLSGDHNLLKAVYESPDFHCHNASMFFGIPFEELFCAETGEKLNVPLRDLAKRVNHGANYNMGEYVLFQTMGLQNVLQAQRLLDLPAQWSPIRVCGYLLQRFDATYPRVRKDWQHELIQEVETTGKLTLECVGWTRRTFLRPRKSKPELNSIVSHKPQSLSVNLVNRSFFRIWQELQLKKYRGKFRLKAQIHDENMFMATDDIVEAAAKEVADLMVIPTVVNGREMVIPSTHSVAKCWADL